MAVTGSSTENFNSLITSGFSTWGDNTTIANWYSQRTGTGSSYSADAGSSTTGELYSYGTGTNSDRALGTIGSGGAPAGHFAHGVLLRNTCGGIITNITVTYTLEQWRNSAAAAQDIKLYYKISSSPITALNPNSNATWTEVPALSATSPITGGTAGAVDGNAALNRVTLSNVAIPSLALVNNDYIMLKWEDPDHTGTDHGLAIDDVTINWTVPPACATPSAAPGTITIPVGSTTSSSINGSFIPASPAPTNYLVVRSPNPTLAAPDLPVNGTSYSIGDAIGTTTVVDIDNNTSFSASGLNDGTLYYFYIFSFNGGACSAGPLYKTDIYSTSSKITRPNLVTSLKVICQTATSATVTWTNPEGNYDGFIILARNSALSPNLPEASVFPAAITANSIFGTAPPVSAAAPPTYAVYKGTGTSVVVTGLTAGQPYSFMAVAYKNDTYSSSSAPTTSIASLRVPEVSSLLANAGNNMVAINWVNPSVGCFDEVLVVANAGAVTFTPVGDGSAYTANGVYTGANQVIYKGIGSNIKVTGLTNGTNYCFKVFVRQGTNWSTGLSICTTANDVTVLAPGDVAIIGFDAQYPSGTTDKIYVTNLVALKTGTKFLLVNSRFEAGAPANTRTNRWYGAGSNVYEDPGVVQFEWQGPGVLAEGSIITFELNGTLANNVSINNILAPSLVGTSLSSAANISTSAPDQLYIMQGVFTPFGTTGVDRYNTFNGKVLFGITVGANWVPFTSAVSAGTTNASRVSRKPADIECLNVYFSGNDGYYYRNSSLHVGTKNQLLSAIINTANYGGNTSTIPEDFSTNTANAIGTAFTISSGLTDGTWTSAGLNTDWFDCRNWAGLAVPDSSTDVTLPTAPFSATVSRASSNAKLFGLDTYIAYAKDLTLSGGEINFTSPTADTLEILGNTLLSSGELNMAIGGIYRLRGSWTKTSGVFSKGIGTIEYMGNTTQTIASENYNNLKSSSVGNRIMSPTGTIGISNVFTKGTNAYTFTNSTIDYNGSGNQSIVDFISTATTPGQTYNNLTLSNVGIKTLTGNTDVEGDFTLNNNVTFTLGANNLRIRSVATQTGRVAPILGSPAINYSGTGRFVIERFFPTHRAWRLMTAPVSTGPEATDHSFFNSYQAGGNNTAANAGNGTYVSGASADPATNGLDVTPLNNYSLKLFDAALGNYVNVTNTKELKISNNSFNAGQPDNFGFFMFVRGDRFNNPNWVTPGVPVNVTTLRDTGKIQIQTYTFNATPTVDKYTLIGNPYASPVDFTKVLTNGSTTGVYNKFWSWDPNINVVGAYVLFDAIAGYNPVKVPASATGTTGQTKIIQSKQAVFVQTSNASSPKVVFKEVDKDAVNNQAAYRPAELPSAPMLASNIYYIENKEKKVLLDGNMVQSAKEFTNQVSNSEDAIKFININENFGIRNGSQLLILDRRAPFTENDTIFYTLTKTSRRKYQLEFIAEKINGDNLVAYLEDSYLKTATPINMTGETWTEFEINAEAASADVNRFRVVFKKAAQFTNIDAYMLNEDIAVTWSLLNEIDMNHHIVERSIDGVHFEAIGTVNSKSNAAKADYSLLDLHPAIGIYYYRVKSVGKYGGIGYSNVVKVKMVNPQNGMYVFPNPVTNNNINLQLNNAEKGTYKVKLINGAGQLMMQKQIVHPGGSVTHTIQADQYLAAGTYQLEVAVPGKKATVIGVVVKR